MRHHALGEDYVIPAGGQVTAFVAKLKALKPDSEQKLADRALWACAMGVWTGRKLPRPRRSVSCFCRRRLPVVLVR